MFNNNNILQDDDDQMGMLLLLLIITFLSSSSCREAFRGDRGHGDTGSRGPSCRMHDRAGCSCLQTVSCHNGCTW